MSFFVSALTGVVRPYIPGVSSGAGSGERYPTAAEAQRAYELKKNTELITMPNYHGDAELDAVLSDAVQGGFARASSAYPRFAAPQIALLRTEAAIGYMCDQIAIDTWARRRDDQASALAWVCFRIAEEGGTGPLEAYQNDIRPRIRTVIAQGLVESHLEAGDLLAEDDLLRISAGLWLYRNSPFHSRAKALLFSGDQTVSGYTPKDERHQLRYENAGVAGRMGIGMDELPEGVIAYDIETDTEFGYGLRPTRTQITEIVLSSKHESLVLAGDEGFILDRFAAFLNSQPAGVTIANWNGQGFDNIALQTRAEFHGTPGWGGRLVPVRNHTPYESVGPTGEPQSLAWTTPAGDQLGEVDLFQEKSQQDRTSGRRVTRGLKPFVESLGATPVKVDRTRLHELTEAERIEYVLSDGLATLRAYTALMPGARES